MARADYKPIEDIDEANKNPGGDELDTHPRYEDTITHNSNEFNVLPPEGISVTEKLTNIIKNYYKSPIGVYPLTEFYYQITETSILIYDRFCAFLIEVGIGSFTDEEVIWILNNLPIYNEGSHGSSRYTYLDFREMRKDGWMVFRRSGADAYLIGYIRKILNNNKPSDTPTADYYFYERSDLITVSPFELEKIEAFIANTIPTIDVTDIVVDKTDLRMLLGKTEQLTVTVYPLNSTNKELLYEISDPSVISIEDNVVKAIGEGIATITVSSVAYPDIRVNIEVTVFEYEYLINNEYEIVPAGSSIYGYPDAYITGISENTNIEMFTKTFKNSSDNLFIFDALGNQIMEPYNLITTGMTVKLIDNGEELDELKIVIPGDCSGDGIISEMDIQLIRYHVNNTSTLEGLEYIAADFDKNGEVNLYDVDAITKYINERY